MNQEWTLDNIYDPVIWVGDLRLMGEYHFQTTVDQEIRIQITKGINSYLIFRFENFMEPGERNIKWEDSVAIGEEVFSQKYGDANGVVFRFRHLQLGDDLGIFKPEYITTLGVLMIHLVYRIQVVPAGILFSVQILGKEKNG